MQHNKEQFIQCFFGPDLPGVWTQEGIDSIYAKIRKYAKSGFSKNSKYAKSVYRKILNTLRE